MAFAGPAASAQCFNNEPWSYASSNSQPIESFPVTKGPDPLSGNWNYDSAIDLFSMDNMMPDTFSMDLPSDPISLDPSYFPVDPFGSPDVSGFAISNSGEDAVSCQSPSELDSDDQLWSPTCPTISPVDPTVDMSASDVRSRAVEMETSRRQSMQSMQSKRSSISTVSSSPDIVPQDDQTEVKQTQPASSTSNQKSSRTRSKESTASQPPNSRNAAKRAAHNVIEKRYRTNMNAKFVALEKAMSGGIQKPTKGESGSLKKSEILANAISYMQKLQDENKSLQKEVSFLKQSVAARGGWRNQRRSDIHFRG
ncbi:hypothetical protein PHISCL_07493 [Aspergillus sclerotialis]|uniref:BHLH domain-containing protein n=1 Tax=Aspergillus sclerotialis TaxID=2070753 RepID=A0A3A2ZB92_9EURO|nr:hypothetical protein PHISCL_07493 [Aspergillus sclerotialis]